MATQEEVAAFLTVFKEKMDLFNMLFRDERMRNSQAMLLWKCPGRKERR